MSAATAPAHAAADAPRWFPLAAIGLALCAALTLVARPLGLGASLVGAGLCLAVAGALPVRDRFARGCWVAAALLCGVCTWRSAGWVASLCLVVAAGCACVGAAGAATWRELAYSVLRPLRFAVPAPLRVLGMFLRESGAREWSRLVPAARGVVLAGLLLAVFVPLLVAADAAFSELLGDLAIDWEVSYPAGRAVAFVAVLGIAGALHRSGGAPRVAPAAEVSARVGVTEWAIALGALVAVFALFVGVQVHYLFGGHDHVLRTAGLTYSEYAREGFGQLIAVAALTLGVIAAAARWAHPHQLLRPLLGGLALLTLVVLASALTRLGLYEEAYGFTRLRFFAHAHILWLAGVFALVLGLGAARRERWMPRAVVALSAAGALAFAATDPDRWIAERNVDRWRESGQLDAYHLVALSSDAAPAVAQLPERYAACAVAFGRRPRADAIASWNLGRARARRALAGLDARDCALWR